MTPRRPAAPIALVPLLASTLLGAAGLHGPAAAITVDGQLDAVYPAAIVVQTTQTGLGTGQITGDNSLGDLTFANGSELDAVHVVVIQNELHLFFAGNLALRLNANQNDTVGHELDFFVDSRAGGQNTLNGLGAGHPLNGLTFDAGFEADYWFQFRGDGDQFGIEWPAVYGTLATSSGGSFTNLGSSTAGGPGTLVGGNNPFGMRVTIDNRNTAGVTYGCDASSGPGPGPGSRPATGCCSGRG
jgi:hypothetical protein